MLYNPLWSNVLLQTTPDSKVKDVNSEYSSQFEQQGRDNFSRDIGQYQNYAIYAYVVKPKLGLNEFTEISHHLIWVKIINSLHSGDITTS